MELHVIERDDDHVPLPRFVDMYVSRSERFSIGQDRYTGGAYVSFPVSNPLVDYEEYYAIDAEQLAAFLDRPSLALAFVTSARRRQQDHLLIFEPGTMRGTPQE